VWGWIEDARGRGRGRGRGWWKIERRSRGSAEDREGEAETPAGEVSTFSRLAFGSTLTHAPCLPVPHGQVSYSDSYLDSSCPYTTPTPRKGKQDEREVHPSIFLVLSLHHSCSLSHHGFSPAPCFIPSCVLFPLSCTRFARRPTFASSADVYTGDGDADADAPGAATRG
jgi:hypothetical protein